MSAPLVTPTEPAHPPGEVLIEAVGLRKKYCADLQLSLRYGLRELVDAALLRQPGQQRLRPGEFWAVDDVSFTLRRGEALGLLGRNGSGKSTLLRMVAGQLRPTAGMVRKRGRMVAMTELGLGFDPTLSGRENAYINAALHGIGRVALEQVMAEIVDFAELGSFIDSPVGSYSSGMKARLGFSVATHLEPDILIADEVLAVGDTGFRRKCINHIAAYLGRGGSLVLVAHDAFLIQTICNRTIVLEKGQVIFAGTALDGVQFHFAGVDDEVALVTALEAAATADPGNEAPRLPPEQAPPAETPLTENEPVAIDRLELLAEDGGPLLTGKPARVEMHYRSLREMSVAWGYHIRTPDLKTSITICTQEVDGLLSQLRVGAHRLVGRIPRLPLLPGNYTLSAAVSESPVFTHLVGRGYAEPPVPFTVEATESNRLTNARLVFGTLIEIDVTWDDAEPPALTLPPG